MKSEWTKIMMIFASGLLAGILLCRIVLPPSFKPGEHKQGKLLEKFTRELTLTPDQQEQVLVILNESRAQFEAIKLQTREKIRLSLSAEQQAKFDTLAAEMDARLAKRRAEWGGKNKKTATP